MKCLGEIIQEHMTEKATDFILVISIPHDKFYKGFQSKYFRLINQQSMFYYRALILTTYFITERNSDFGRFSNQPPQ